MKKKKKDRKEKKRKYIKYIVLTLLSIYEMQTDHIQSYYKAIKHLSFPLTQKMNSMELAKKSHIQKQKNHCLIYLCILDSIKHKFLEIVLVETTMLTVKATKTNNKLKFNSH